MPEWTDRLIRFARALVPTLLCIAIVLVSVLPFGAGSSYVAIGPMLAFGLLVAWSVCRPDDITPWVVFFVGIAIDCLTGCPLGLWSFSFLVGYGLALLQRSSLLTYPVLVITLTYAVIGGFTALTAWAAAAAYLAAFVDPFPLLIGCVVSVIMFPFLIWIGGRPNEDAVRRFERA